MDKEAIKQDTLFDIKSGTLTLPHGIVLENGIVRTLAKTVTMRDISGFEEDMLRDTRRADGGKGKLVLKGSERVTAVLARCTISIGDKEVPDNLDSKKAHEKHFKNLWDRAVSGDRSFALNSLRRLSVGDRYTFNHTCPECHREIRNITVDLSELSVFPPFRDIKESETLSAEDVAKLREERAIKDEHTVTTPSGRIVVYKLLRGNQEDSFVESIKDADEDRPTVSIAHRLVSIDGSPATKAEVKAMRGMDRRFLDNLFGDVEGGLDSEIEITCDGKECSHTFRTNIDFGKQSFFFPSGT